MPFVNVKITKTGVTKEQKREIVEGITDTLSRVLNKRPEATHIVIEEVELENWGVGRKLVADRDK